MAENRIMHLTDIPKGVYGEFSKIEEEFLELKDSIIQGDKVLTICELTDLIGAIEGFSQSRFNLTINDLVKFSNKISSIKNK